MEDFSKYYQLLGLASGASPAEVKQAYRDLVKVWHPDRFAHDERLRLKAQEQLKEINGAYEILMAQAFETSTAAEPSVEPEAEVVPPVRRSWLVWLIVVGALTIILAAVLFFGKSSGGKGLVRAKTNEIAAAQNQISLNARYALKFNANNAHVLLGMTGALTGTFTVECWALTHQAKQVGTILSSCAPADFAFDLKFRQGKRFHADIGDGKHWLAKMANARIPYERDTWYHLAYVVTPDMYRIYVNGMLVDDGEIAPAGQPMLFDEQHQLWLCADGITSDFLDGRIADIRIWRTARTETQIAAGMNELMPGDSPGLVANWRFSEGAGTIAADSSGHGFTATLDGAVGWSSAVPANLRR